MIGFLAELILYFHVCVVVFARMMPSYLPKERCRAERSNEVPIKMMGFLHALITSFHALAYCLDWIGWTELERARTFSTAFLCFDFAQSVTFYTRDGQAAVLANPWGVGFHHVMTIIFMYGIFFNYSIAGSLAFMLSEIPVCFLNLTWLHFYVGQSKSRTCAVCSILTIFTYAIFRIIGFPLFFMCVMVPQLNWFNPFSTFLIFPLFLGIYALNCYWFLNLWSKTMSLVPNLYLVPSWAWQFPLYTWTRSAASSVSSAASTLPIPSPSSLLSSVSSDPPTVQNGSL